MKHLHARAACVSSGGSDTGEDTGRDARGDGRGSTGGLGMRTDGGSEDGKGSELGRGEHGARGCVDRRLKAKDIRGVEGFIVKSGVKFETWENPAPRTMSIRDRSHTDRSGLCNGWQVFFLLLSLSVSRAYPQVHITLVILPSRAVSVETSNDRQVARDEHSSGG
jgi:hypothetical protein